MNKTATRHNNSNINLYALKEAQEAIFKILTLKPLLSKKDEETLSLLLDKKLMNQLKKSLKEAEIGELEPLKNILK